MGVRGSFLSQLTPRLPDSLGSCALQYPNDAGPVWSPLPQKHPGHTQRTHGTHGIDTGTRHDSATQTAGWDLTRRPPQLVLNFSLLGPYKSQCTGQGSGGLSPGAARARPELGGQQLSQAGRPSHLVLQLIHPVCLCGPPSMNSAGPAGYS